ncbi:MAG: RidA family protein [Desulfobacterales bacterium]
MKIVKTIEAPAAIGPYSQAIIHGDLVFCSGVVPLDPQTMKVVEGGIEAQSERVLKNLAAVLKAAGSDVPKVIKTTVFLKDMETFKAMNAAYERVFAGHRPARSTVEVARLPLDVMVEIECIAVVD